VGPVGLQRNQRDEAREIIKEVLWCGGGPPAIQKGWSMKSELAIWNKMAREYGNRLNPALRVSREALGIPAGHAVTMLLFYGKERQHLIRRCLEFVQRRKGDSPGHASDALRSWARRYAR